MFVTDVEVDEEEFTAIPQLEKVSEYRQISHYFSGSPILNAIIVNARKIDLLNSQDVDDRNLLDKLRKNISRLHTIVDEWLNTGHYSTIHDKFRLIYSYVSALQAVLAYKCGQFLDSLRACDDGLLKGNDLEDDSLARFSSFLCRKKLPKCPSFKEHEGIIHLEKVQPTLFSNYNYIS